MRSNCWDITQCGREPGGKLATQLGVCAVSTDKYFDGTNGGVNAGRCCWRVAGTLFGGRANCMKLEEVGSCQNCIVYSTVLSEEGRRLRL